METDTFITVASWEERFWLGFEDEIIKSGSPNVLMYYYSEYADQTSENRQRVVDLCESNQIHLEQQPLSFAQPVQSWKVVYETITQMEPSNKTITLHITTMPRETIWTILNLLDGQCKNINYIYQSPESYGADWLSRDPDKPRLVYKLAGIARLGAPTKLLVLTGYDVERVQQLVDFFEPERVFLGVQLGDQLENKSRNVDKHQWFRREPGVEWFDVDAYGHDHGMANIEKKVGPYFETGNVVMSSLGPKLSAIALYRVHKKYAHTALAYAPSREFNPKYSHGIGQTYMGKL